MRVVIDTDPATGVPGADIDDGIAIGLALRSPDVRVECLTVVEGNVPLATGVEVALGLVALAGAAIPVHAGADRPLVEDPAPWRARLRHWGDIDLDRQWSGIQPASPGGSRPDATDAADAIIRAVRTYPNEVTLVAIGPLTNVATALQRDPAIVPLIPRIVAMGGAFAVSGWLQEFNMGFDPEAAHVVLSSGIPTVLVPLDVTLRTSFPRAVAEELAASSDPLVAHLGRTAVPYIALVEARTGRTGCPLHDPLAMAAALNPDLVTTASRRVDVELAGTLTRGRPVAWDANGRVTAPGLRLPELAPIDVVTEVDNDALLDVLRRALL